MTRKTLAAFLVLATVLASAALAFVLYFSPTDEADAVTYDVEAGFTLSCDALSGGAHPSCTLGSEPNAPEETADII